MVEEAGTLIRIFTEFENTLRENIALLKKQQHCMIKGEYDVFEQLTATQEDFDRKLRTIEQQRSAVSESLCEGLSIPADASILQIVETLGEEGRELMLSVSRMVEAMRELTFSRTNLERMINFQLSYIDFLQSGRDGTGRMHTYNPAGKSANLRKTERFQGDG